MFLLFLQTCHYVTGMRQYKESPMIKGRKVNIAEVNMGKKLWVMDVVDHLPIANNQFEQHQVYYEF